MSFWWFVTFDGHALIIIVTCIIIHILMFLICIWYRTSFYITVHLNVAYSVIVEEECIRKDLRRTMHFVMNVVCTMQEHFSFVFSYFPSLSCSKWGYDVVWSLSEWSQDRTSWAEELQVLAKHVCSNKSIFLSKDVVSRILHWYHTFYSSAITVVGNGLDAKRWSADWGSLSPTEKLEFKRLAAQRKTSGVVQNGIERGKCITASLKLIGKQACFKIMNYKLHLVKVRVGQF